jgi:prepilin-type N-terminal cleavage/methylation domain-containing protein
MHKVRGFTLIELMTVIAIIGILMSIIMVGLGNAKAKSRDSRRIADVKNIQLALSLYYNDNGMYPKDIYEAPCTTTTVAPNCGLAPTYLPVVPTDPSYPSVVCSALGNANEDSCYRYTALKPSGGSLICNATNAPTSYHIGAILEDSGNASLSNDTDAPLTPGTRGNIVTTGWAVCNTVGGTIGTADFDGYSCTSSAGAAEGTCYDMFP